MSASSKENYTRFTNIGFDDFRAMARDSALSKYEKIGFPDNYREGKETAIFEDICTKLPALQEKNSRVVDIGSGCSELPLLLMRRAEQNGQRLILIDSEEMHMHIPSSPAAQKLAACFPDCPALFEEYRGKIDAILTYSVLQYVFAEGNVFTFLDQSLSLLAPQGRMLIGDIPNVSMRKRFFASDAGKKLHREFTGRDEDPQVSFNSIEHETIDDSVVLGLAARARAQGFHTFIVPQPPALPMANRREDLLIIRP